MQFKIIFLDSDVTIRAELQITQAPKTTQAFIELLKTTSIQTKARHAMYTGKEISIQLPKELCESTALHEPAPENLTWLPQSGDILFTFMPENAWQGVASPIYDFGLFYGKEARTLFPAGIIPGNIFARVIEEDLEELTEIGNLIHLNGQQNVRIEI